MSGDTNTTDLAEVTAAGGHLTADQHQKLIARRAAADKAMTRARKVIEEVGPNPDAKGRRRIGNAAQKVADARQLHDDLAKHWGAPTLPPLQATRKPAGPKPRSTDEVVINAAKRELTEASQRAAANFNQRGGTLGGKQASRIANGRIRRTAQYSRQADQAKARLRGLGVPETEINETAEAPWRGRVAGT